MPAAGKFIEPTNGRNGRVKMPRSGISGLKPIASASHGLAVLLATLSCSRSTSRELPATNPSGNLQATVDLRQAALERASARSGARLEDLIVVNSLRLTYPLTERRPHLFKIAGKTRAVTPQLLVLNDDGTDADQSQLAAAEDAEYAGRYGKLDIGLHARLSTALPGERIPVSIVLAEPSPLVDPRPQPPPLRFPTSEAESRDVEEENERFFAAAYAYRKTEVGLDHRFGQRGPGAAVAAVSGVASA